MYCLLLIRRRTFLSRYGFIGEPTFPIEEKLKEYEGITGDKDLIRKAWENIEQRAT